MKKSICWWDKSNWLSRYGHGLPTCSAVIQHVSSLAVTTISIRCIKMTVTIYTQGIIAIIKLHLTLTELWELCAAFYFYIVMAPSLLFPQRLRHKCFTFQQKWLRVNTITDHQMKVGASTPCVCTTSEKMDGWMDEQLLCFIFFHAVVMNQTWGHMH